MCICICICIYIYIYTLAGRLSAGCVETATAFDARLLQTKTPELAKTPQPEPFERSPQDAAPMPSSRGIHRTRDPELPEYRSGRWPQVLCHQDGGFP